jgi:hypothetical protein
MTNDRAPRKMGRPLTGTAARSLTLRVRLEPAELAQIDAARGTVTRSEWARVTLAAAARSAPPTISPAGVTWTAEQLTAEGLEIAVTRYDACDRPMYGVGRAP